MPLNQIIISWFKDYGSLIVVALTLVEIAPIKINPWKWIFKVIGNLLFGEIREEIKDIDTKLSDLKSDFENNKAKEKRWHILDFVNSCRRHEDHSREEWSHAMAELAEYEVYCKLHEIKNGVIDEDAKYLRQLYYERNLKNDFL